MKNAKYLKYNETESDVSFYVASHKLQERGDIVFDLPAIHDLFERQFKSLDEFYNERYGLFWTTVLNKNLWLYSLCDCPDFLKNYMCVHIVGMALREKCCKLPKKAIAVPLKKKPIKGRKPKAGPALKK